MVTKLKSLNCDKTEKNKTVTNLKIKVVTKLKKTPLLTKFKSQIVTKLGLGQNLIYEPKQGPTQHRLMSHPVVLRYISYSTMLAEHAVHRLQQCPAFGWAGTCLFLSVQLDGQSVTS